MPTPILTVQYLENSPELSSINKSALLERLRHAADILPFSHLLVGWDLPQPLLEACRLEAERLGLRFLLWLPLLTMEKGNSPEIDRGVEGLTGHPVEGYKNQPEFTFMCPNHPATQEVISTRIESLLHSGIYQGFFLDRVRFPSPSHDPINHLACFCEHCRRKAAQDGLDLEEIRNLLLEQVRQEQGCMSLAAALLSNGPVTYDYAPLPVARELLSFRQNCISEFLALVTRPLREAHSEIGLDCFSPSLACMVGQDINCLGQLADWMKLMTYLHTYAPAGLPYELGGMLQFLTNASQHPGMQALELISKCTGLLSPFQLPTLDQEGLPSEALFVELRRGLQATSTPTLAGIELVELPGVTRLNAAQIQSDLEAISRAQPAGLAISWDLWHIPLDRLKMVAQVYLGKG